MTPSEPITSTGLKNDLIEALVAFGLLTALLVAVMTILAPFAHLVSWALILAVSLYPLHASLARRMDGRDGRAATAIVLSGLVLIGVPAVLLGVAFAGEAQSAYVAVRGGEFEIPPPKPGIANWPVVGEQLHAAWSTAAEDLPAFLEEHRTKLRDLTRAAFSAAAGTMLTVLLFLVSLVVAGIVMAYAEGGTRTMDRIATRLTDSDRGPRLVRLCAATTRSVAVGVLGVALIQALILGVGFLFSGVPLPGLLALVTLFIGILQLPALILTIPAIAWLWTLGDASATVNVIATIYLIVGGLADGVLKPMLLGRGVEAPMPVILIGALGGMAAAGLVGLFSGAVLLTLGYVVFMEWAAAEEEDEAPPDAGIV